MSENIPLSAFGSNFKQNINRSGKTSNREREGDFISSPDMHSHGYVSHGVSQRRLL